MDDRGYSMEKSKRDALTDSFARGEISSNELITALKVSAQNTVNARKSGFVAVTLSFCDEELKSMTVKKAIGITRAIRRQFIQYADEVSGYYQVMIVLADWHHGARYRINEDTPLLDDGYGTNSSDLHFHLLIYGTPKDTMIKDVLFAWWGKRHGKYYGFKHLPDDIEAQTVKYQNNADAGWYKYVMDNMIGSSDSLKEQAGRSLIFRFSTAGKESAWRDCEWLMRLPPIKSRMNLKKWEEKQREAEEESRVSLLKSLEP